MHPVLAVSLSLTLAFKRVTSFFVEDCATSITPLSAAFCPFLVKGIIFCSVCILWTSYLVCTVLVSVLTVFCLASYYFYLVSRLFLSDSFLEHLRQHPFLASTLNHSHWLHYPSGCTCYPGSWLSTRILKNFQNPPPPPPVLHKKRYIHPNSEFEVSNSNTQQHGRCDDSS